MKSYRKLSIIGHNVYEELKIILQDEQPDSYQILEVRNVGVGTISQLQELIVMLCHEDKVEIEQD